MTQTFIGTLVVEHCCNCGVAFGMEQSFYNKQRELGPNGSFHCPNGHPQHYRYAKGNELEDQLADKQRRLQEKQRSIDSLHDQLTLEKHKVRAEKAAKTRLKNRVKHGVCPCCNRTFKQLADHMKTKHPDYVAV